MQPDAQGIDQEKTQSSPHLTQDLLVFWYLDQIEPVLVKDLKLSIVHVLRSAYFSDGSKALKSRNFADAGKLFLSIQLTPPMIHQIFQSRPTDEYSIRTFFTPEILTHFEESANQENARALLEIGRAYFDDGLPEDVEIALHWFELSAKLGYVDAQMLLGIIYREGESSVEKNSEKALHFYKLASEQGNWDASKDLGSMYEEGDGVEKDLWEALRWYKLSAAQGNFMADFDIRRINSNPPW